MAEKVVDKLKRISRDLADSVRAEIDLRHSLVSTDKELRDLKTYIACYVSDKEGITSPEEAVSFVKGYHKAKHASNEQQMPLNFDKK